MALYEVQISRKCASLDKLSTAHNPLKLTFNISLILLILFSQDCHLLRLAMLACLDQVYIDTRCHLAVLVITAIPGDLVVTWIHLLIYQCSYSLSTNIKHIHLNPGRLWQLESYNSFAVEWVRVVLKYRKIFRQENSLNSGLICI